MRLLRFVAPLLLLQFGYPLCSFADDSREGVERVLQWREPSRVVLELRGGASGNASKWAADFGEQGDFDLLIGEDAEPDLEKGRILLISGQAMIVQGIDLEPGYEIDAIDMPAFHFQLLYGILENLFPGGPGTVTEEVPVEHAESDEPITVGTASATGEFGAPWFVKGTVSRGVDQGVHYDLVFTFTVDPAEAMTFTLRLSGTWTGGNTPNTISDDFDITGWSVYTIGPYEVEMENGNTTQYLARPTGETYRTVGELRRAIEKAENEAESE
jgi:hypothetical protein